ncbi:uncharacterized protein BYT42DRAFT_642264 [Radiomyces spectabilis]|uniref:uncharacterized protein n=1 Tax=Radiomyces spectabilis TaxID=64574 RepID=UPI00221FF8DB|nr:uncharacterized protein BYT42DRAFT_642264 [Radiomyces spectabilis]KAI8387972.1 hypothetical protein BYT42DRAFT_642264 [Radiomyces spectabilis]
MLTDTPTFSHPTIAPRGFQDPVLHKESQKMPTVTSHGPPSPPASINKDNNDTSLNDSSVVQKGVDDLVQNPTACPVDHIIPQFHNNTNEHHRPSDRSGSNSLKQDIREACEKAVNELMDHHDREHSNESPRDDVAPAMNKLLEADRKAKSLLLPVAASNVNQDDHALTKPENNQVVPKEDNDMALVKKEDQQVVPKEDNDMALMKQENHQVVPKNDKSNLPILKTEDHRVVPKDASPPVLYSIPTNDLPSMNKEPHRPKITEMLSSTFSSSAPMANEFPKSSPLRDRFYRTIYWEKPLYSLLALGLSLGGAYLLCTPRVMLGALVWTMTVTWTVTVSTHLMRIMLDKPQLGHPFSKWLDRTSSFETSGSKNLVQSTVRSFLNELEDVVRIRDTETSLIWMAGSVIVWNMSGHISLRTMLFVAIFFLFSVPKVMHTSGAKARLHASLQSS